MNAPNRTPRLYTPAQIASASLIGGPLPACWLVAHNARELHQPAQRTTWLASGIVGTLLLLALVLFVIPERFPRYIIPVAYTVALRELARKAQGDAISSHRAAGGAVGSWWAVVGFGVAGFVLFFAVIIVIAFFFPSAFPE
jgi:hypothetical protein